MICCFVGYTATSCHVYIFSYTFLSSSTRSTESAAFALVLLSSALIAVKWISNYLTVSLPYCIPAGKNLYNAGPCDMLVSSSKAPKKPRNR